MFIGILFTNGRMYTRTVALLVLLVLYLVSCISAQSCICNQLKCELPVNCSHGEVLDECGCCMECARGLNEQCVVMGRPGSGVPACGDGLRCIIKAEPGDVVTRRQTHGTCQELPQGCDPLACDSSVVHRCPADSVLVYNGTNDDSRCCKAVYECRCDVSVCKVPRCAAGHSPQILRHSNGKPGFCCDLYHCKVSGCRSTNGKVYKNLDTWKEGDCVTCRCVNGKKQCQAEMCVKSCLNPKYVPGRCCPICDAPRLYPNQSSNKCPDLSTCNITCETGLQQTPDGCHNCKCKPEGCYKDCRYGYIFNETGHQSCECHKPPSECPTLSNCSKKCNHGYKLSKKGCPKCRCNKCQSLTCDKVCNQGYQKDKFGCKVCKCQESLWEKNCTFNNQEYSVGQSWQLSLCTVCVCKRDGIAECESVTCPVPKCSFMVKKEGQCCPICLNVSISHIHHENKNSQSKFEQVSEQNPNAEDDIQEMEEKYIISLSIVGTFVMILLILVFVLLYLKLKQRHQASWSVAGQDSYCKCPLFIGHSPTLQHKYNINGDIPNKLGYDTVVVQKFNHPCVQVSLTPDSPMDEKKNFISDGEKDNDFVNEKNSVNVKSNYPYNEWAAM